jgi:UDP-N-acetylglucosamine 2-epimerase (non-hydrolysing)
MKKILIVAGARPNFMKIAPLLRALEKHPSVRPVVVHTGQHYDDGMSASFFRDLGIPKPRYHLNAGSGTHAEQTAAVMTRFEKVCLRERPHTVVVVGDVNSTIAAGLVAKKAGARLAHVEAGLRSRDPSMPEEINRMATDAVADLLFTTERSGTENLLREGRPRARVRFAGNVMIDNLLYQLDKQKKRPPSAAAAALKRRLRRPYLCLTLHRPSNVDDRRKLSGIVAALAAAAAGAPVVFPCHPRTRARIRAFGLAGKFAVLDRSERPLTRGVHMTGPLGYNDFLFLWKDAAAVVTDSGGLQEETTALGVPCITVRENTERPVTLSQGTNVLAGTRPGRILSLVKRALRGGWKKGRRPALWDGRAGERIADTLARER